MKEETILKLPLNLANQVLHLIANSTTSLRLQDAISVIDQLRNLEPLEVTNDNSNPETQDEES